MTPRSTSRQDAIIGMAEYIKLNGLSGASLRTLADSVGTSDRMLLYYFKDKTDIMATVLQYLAEDIGDALAEAIPMGPRLPSDALFMKVVEFTQSDVLKPYMELRLEIATKALSEPAPYKEVAKTISDTLVTWFDDRLQVANMDARRTRAVMLLAMIDGLFQVNSSTDETTFTQARNAIVMALRGMG